MAKTPSSSSGAMDERPAAGPAFGILARLPHLRHPFVSHTVTDNVKSDPFTATFALGQDGGRQGDPRSIRSGEEPRRSRRIKTRGG